MAPPKIILVNPQMGENIGAAARVMHNFALEELRLVAPRDGWPNSKSAEMACNAQHIIHNAELYSSVTEAVKGVDFLLAATARPRDMVKTVVTPRQAGSLLQEKSQQGQRCGILFGPERSGLANADLILADALVTIPINPAYPSLNLAQSVAILCYEWFTSGDREPTPGARPETPAKKEDVAGFFNHLEQALDKADFFKVPEKKERMLFNIHNLFIRAGMTEQDVRTLRGILTSLERK